MWFFQKCVFYRERELIVFVDFSDFLTFPCCKKNWCRQHITDDINIFNF